MLHNLSILLLVIGIAMGILCLCYCDISDMEHIGSRYGTTFNATMFTTGVFSILGSIIQYAFFRVVIEISLTLKGGALMRADKNTSLPMRDVVDAFKEISLK